MRVEQTSVDESFVVGREPHVTTRAIEDIRAGREARAKNLIKSESPEAFQPQSPAQVREVLHSGKWKTFGQTSLLSLLDASIILYGIEINGNDIRYIGELYAFSIKAGMDVESRLTIEGRILDLVQKEELSAVAFLPFLVQDPDQGLVAKTTIDFVGASPYFGNELYALGELRPLIKNRILANRAAAFGALVSMGDTELLPLIAELRPELSWEEIQCAARVHTSFLQHTQFNSG